MSKSNLRELEIRTEDDLEGLSDADLRWLLERDRIPNYLKEGAEISLTDLHEESVPMSARANTGDVRSMTTEELEVELERRRAAAEENPNREGDDPHFESEDDDDDDEETPRRVAKKAPAKKAAAKKAASRTSSDDDDDDDDDED